ncbi:hydrogenase maturation protease [Streptomyces beihaiensis]|uniref:Hydrogenase maturation protease n=1 Tax=Streptomyces beihaiensis TaxID=2984495 RepID=A0ABT3U3P9_9ACTN|nr:hydrogenase maturation protease [Streptomyces beihaiensis]MCX3062875.1 hydrogenase maturation protease [Streptomyces beihaiensis]
MSTPRVLIAGLGNIFLGDDGFGVEAVGRLARRALPDGVRTLDVGVRGVHLAYQLLDGYDCVVLVDATARGGAPGTVYRIDDPHTDPHTGPASVPGAAVIDGHRMTPDAVLALLETLSAGMRAAPPARIRLVGCEPADLSEGMGLTDAVEAAIEPALAAVLRIVAEETGHPQAAPPMPFATKEQRS